MQKLNLPFFNPTWSIQPNCDIGPLSTCACTPSCGGKVALAHVGTELGGITVYVAWQPPVFPNLSNCKLFKYGSLSGRFHIPCIFDTTIWYGKTVKADLQEYSQGCPGEMGQASPGKREAHEESTNFNEKNAIRIWEYRLLEQPAESWIFLQKKIVGDAGGERCELPDDSRSIDLQVIRGGRIWARNKLERKDSPLREFHTQRQYPLPK